MDNTDKSKKRKTPKTYRLSPEALQILDKLSDKLGLSDTAVIELALRKLLEWDNKA